MMKVKDWHAVLALALAVAGCRYRYELLPSLSDESAAGTGGAGSVAGSSAVAGDANGGAPEGGAPDGPGGSGGSVAGGDAGGGVGGVTAGGGGGNSGAAGDGGNGGSAGGTPPDMALCTPGSYGGHEYLICQELRSWDDANGGCIAIGMRLARVDDANENDWLYDTIRTGAATEVWLGATDRAVEGEWLWTDGEGFWLGDDGGTAQNGLFSGWYFREPNNVNEEDCGALEAQSAKPEWYDFQCHIALAYVCESL
jgi:hypothetical protein